MPLGFKLADDDDRDNYLVLVEAQHSARIGEQDAGVENVGASGTSPGGGTTSVAVRHVGPPGRRSDAVALSRRYPRRRPLTRTETHRFLPTAQMAVKALASRRTGGCEPRSRAAR